jgi:plasmid replication initiation protein
MINEVTKMMEINARNMVAFHFRRRLHQYIRFRYAPQRELQLKYKDTKRLVDSCYRVRKVPVIDDEWRPTGQLTSAWTEWDVTNDSIEELRERLGIVPWE